MRIGSVDSRVDRDGHPLDLLESHTTACFERCRVSFLETNNAGDKRQITRETNDKQRERQTTRETNDAGDKRRGRQTMRETNDAGVMGSWDDGKEGRGRDKGLYSINLVWYRYIILI
jgi:hypothetical protein